jgi:hypothetical protein
MTPAFLLHKGRTLPVKAKCRSNGIECLVVEEAPGIPALVPLTQAIAAPARTKPHRIWENPNAV